MVAIARGRDFLQLNILTGFDVDSMPGDPLAAHWHSHDLFEINLLGELKITMP